MLDCICKVNDADDNDLVGIEYRPVHEDENGEKSGGDVIIHFPLGYRLSPADDEHGRRRDILLLIACLRRYSQKVDGSRPEKEKAKDIVFPIDAYLTIISDYVARGYYREKETVYKTAKRGKISWGRTIKTQKPCVQGNQVLYLDFTVRNEKVRENEWITLIHKYCVYLSFKRMGWLFTGFIPPKPQIRVNDRFFSSVLRDKLVHTFNDRNRRLFRSMMVVLDYEEETGREAAFQYGTTSFYHVWESMIDYVYGIDSKQDYFPHTKWRIRNRRKGGVYFYVESPLEPDSIMPYGKDIFILDAKYYKYGVTGRVVDLPDTSSIHKQITYGEFIDNRDNLRPQGQIYNAFILPYNSANTKGLDYIGELDCLGEAVTDWKPGNKTYERVEGILLDTKMLMELNVRKDMVRIEELADFIEHSYKMERLIDRRENGDGDIRV